MKNMPIVSVIIVTWNSQKWIGKCLQSVFKETSDIPFEVIVIDNNSHDDTVQIALNDFVGVNVIQNPDNKGFAYAVNQGIEAASGEYYFLLNPDTMVIDRAIEQMVGYMQEHQEVGILGPHMMNEDQTTQPSVRRFPRLKDQLMIALKLHHLRPDAKAIYDYLQRGFNYQQTQDVDQVMGAAFMIRKEVTSLIGIFDETFFIWFEEVDYCKRLIERTSLKVRYYAQAHIVHFSGDSFDQVGSKRKHKWFRKSSKYYFKKHGQWGAYFTLVLFAPLIWLVNMFARSAERSMRGKQAQQQAKQSLKQE